MPTIDEDIRDLCDGFDPVEVPEPPPADALAAQLDAEAADELAAKPADYDIKAFAVREPNTYDCRDKLKAMGCRFVKSVGAWVAKDRVMYESAVDLCRVANGRKPLFANPPGIRQKLIAEAKSALLDKPWPKQRFEIKPAPHERRSGIPSEQAPQSSSLNVDNETLVAEAQRRGFTIAKLGTLEPLAELLGAQDDEDDPFEKILEALK